MKNYSLSILMLKEYYYDLFEKLMIKIKDLD